MQKLANFNGFLAAQAPKGPSNAVSERPALPKVALETPFGTLVAEIDTAAAPLTAANFLRYIDAGAYDGGQFHRVVHRNNQPNDEIRIGVIQGSRRADSPVYDAIQLERTTITGLRHLHGTLSMARIGPDTARDQFFICVGDQPELDFAGRRNPDGQGFAAFGRIVSGWLALEQIQNAPANGQTLAPPIKILHARRA